MTIDECIRLIENDIRANESIINNLKEKMEFVDNADELIDYAVGIRTLEHVNSAYKSCLRRIKMAV